MNGAEYQLVRIARQVGDDVVIFTLRCEDALFELMAEYADSMMQSLGFI